MRATGIDVSKYDKWFDPKQSIHQIDFVIQRVGYGGSLGGCVKDEKFNVLYPAVREIPIRGGYWYINSHVNWKRQADFYLESVLGKEYHFHDCDFESDYNEMSLGFGSEAMEWINYVAIETKQKVLQYSNASCYDAYLSWDKRTKNVPLWMAWPNEPIDEQTTEPYLPKKRKAKDWTFWQHSYNNLVGHEWGVGSADVDLDVFNGTVADLRTWLGLDVVTPPDNTPTDAEKLSTLWDAHPELHRTT